MAAATTFIAEVSITGSADAGDMAISINQIEEQPVPPFPEPPDGEWVPPSYLRTDTRQENISNAPRPAYLTPYTDPVFKTKIIRVTDDPGRPIKNISGKTWPDVARHHYSSDQAWNCNQTLIYLDAPGLFIDGETYEPKFMQNGRPSDSDVRWHASDPAVLLYAAGSKLGTWNPQSGSKMTIEDFSGYSGLKFGPWEGSPSEDGDMVVLSFDGGAFAYKISTDKKYPDIKKFSGVDNARISPLGNYIIWGCEPDHVIVTDLQGNQVLDLPEDAVSHFDVVVDCDGEECIVGRNNTSGPMTKYRMRDGRKTQLCPGGWCSHTSTRSKTRRWAVSAPTDEGGNVPPPYRGEAIMSALDGSVTFRLGHTHEPATIDYKAETQPSHSPDGGRVIFASAWGGSGSTPRPIGCYVIDFRT